MTGELQTKIGDIIKDKTTSEQMLDIIRTAGQEFPCLSCPSKDECKTFNWYTKWFGARDSVQAIV